MNFVTTLMGRFGLLKEDLDWYFSGLRNPVGTNATFATSSGFGKIAGTQPNRQMQLSARFFF
jgi:hypothetical protein